MIVNEIVESFAKEQNIAITKLSASSIDSYLIEKNSLSQLLVFLKNNDDLSYKLLIDLFAVDFPKREKRFELVYNLLSLKLNSRFILKILLSDQEDVESVDSIFSSACWYEREAFDMFGIKFRNSSDNRRILTDYNFDGHPLRKDFPLTGYVQVKYDEKLEKVVNEPVSLEQEYRSFDFVSPWSKSGDFILPGDEKCNYNK